MKSRTPWYDNRFTVIILLFLFFPVGLYGLWKNKKFAKITKYAWTTFILFSVITFGFSDKLQSNNPDPVVPVVKKETIQPQSKVTNTQQRFEENTPEVTQARAELKVLYQELMDFKDTPKFHEMGFGKGNQLTNTWLDKAKKLDDKLSPKQYPFNLCVAAADLQQLGLEYMRSKGQETDYSTNTTPSIKNEF